MQKKYDYSFVQPALFGRTLAVPDELGNNPRSSNGIEVARVSLLNTADVEARNVYFPSPMTRHKIELVV
jgi:hypothetical protein